MVEAPYIIASVRRLILSLLMALCPVVGMAQDAYPSRSVRMVIDTSPGGVTDLFGRLMAEALAQKLGQTVFVDNKPGASGNLAIDFLVRAAPDGYTLMIASGGGLVVKPFLEHGLTFDVMNDLAPVFNVAETAHILVVPPAVPAKDIAEFIAYAKAQPKPLHYGSAGFGSPPHLSMELFARAAGLKMVHVPYKGVGGAMPDLLAGRVQAMSMALGSARAYLKNGQLRPLATGAKRRIAGLPDLPTSAEAGLPRWEMSAWFGIFAPRGTPPAIVRLLNAKMQEVLDEPKLRERFFDAGAEPIGGSVESFAERYRADHRMWGDFIKETGIKQE
ncbi:MAG: tripartite tricarboxylate transporter substrate binding protein [Betaproteobacteria bacterium]|jgi:tripartite-type tricarboxylate transporter receptor subunit TctC|nr:MAG: tripartite tricarboxylate transporter substrate binding protein [Betaproteobacteria bacterium]TMH99733.1 MAG: tripartite tricarboxylate transporter substrate binding protein [Betaproteobacteria bacterium]TMI00072.1 MAG: tripartite tricarboxylate transporter substrate binding protein [Betaproteobacteria bacterium]